jgi:hypothetical protein
MGSGGLLRRASGGWDFLPVGSRDWDAYHQEIYRNSRGERLDAKALAERGLTLPPLDEYRNRPAVSWEDNFPSEVELKQFPPAVARLLGNEATVYVVMLEDGYETSFGDGKFLYPERAFMDRAEAERFVEDKAKDPDEAKRQWYRYTLKEVHIRVAGGRAKAALDLQPYEHMSAADVLRVLA